MHNEAEALEPFSDCGIGEEVVREEVASDALNALFGSALDDVFEERAAETAAPVARPLLAPTGEDAGKPGGLERQKRFVIEHQQVLQEQVLRPDETVGRCSEQGPVEDLEDPKAAFFEELEPVPLAGFVEEPLLDCLMRHWKFRGKRFGSK